MKNNKQFTLVSLFLGIVLLLAAGISTAFTVDSPAEKFFVVAKKGQKISADKKKILMGFFKKVHGNSSKVETIELLKVDGEIWLAFQSGNKKTPSMGVVLTLKNGSYGFPPNGPLGINTCTSDSDCTSCKTPCACGRNGGGGTCVKKTTDQKGFGKEALEFLTPYM